MRLKGKDIKKLIKTLTNIYNENGGSNCDETSIELDSHCLNVIEKEEFIEPELWCLRVDKSNSGIINHWRNYHQGLKGNCPDGYISEYGWGVNETHGEEISYDDFYNHILTDEMKKDYLNPF